MVGSFWNILGTVLLRTCSQSGLEEVLLQSNRQSREKWQLRETKAKSLNWFLKISLLNQLELHQLPIFHPKFNTNIRVYFRAECLARTPLDLQPTYGSRVLFPRSLFRQSLKFCLKSTSINFIGPSRTVDNVYVKEISLCAKEIIL